MEKCRSEEQMSLFTPPPQVNAVDDCNSDKIMQHVSWVKTNNIDLGGKGGLQNISVELVGAVIFAEKCWESLFVTRGFGEDCSNMQTPIYQLKDRFGGATCSYTWTYISAWVGRPNTTLNIKWS